MNYTLTLTEQEIAIVGAGLGKLPFEAVAPLIQRLNQQIAEQAPKAEPEKKVKK